MIRTIFAACALLATALPAWSQENNLVGNWSGSYLYTGATTRTVDIGIELKVDKLEGAVVTGSARTIGGNCAGEYQMRGKFDGQNLGMISTNSAGAAGDCKFGFRAKLDGDRMIGTVGTYEMRLSKK